jgi:hypothetical protein
MTQARRLSAGPSHEDLRARHRALRCDGRGGYPDSRVRASARRLNAIAGPSCPTRARHPVPDHRCGAAPDSHRIPWTIFRLPTQMLCWTPSTSTRYAIRNRRSIGTIDFYPSCRPPHLHSRRQCARACFEASRTRSNSMRVSEEACTDPASPTATRPETWSRDIRLRRLPRIRRMVNAAIRHTRKGRSIRWIARLATAGERLVSPSPRARAAILARARCA